MQRKLTCIICPRGCELTANINGDEIEVSGQSCPRGKAYAVDECIHPMRTVTSTVRVSDKENTMVSVRTAAPIPKEKIFEVMEIIRGTEVKSPVKIGDVVVSDVFGTDIIITKDIL